MNNLHPEVTIEIKRNRFGGIEWRTLRNGHLSGAGVAWDSVQDALEEALDDLRMLGLVETTEATSG